MYAGGAARESGTASRMSIRQKWASRGSKAPVVIPRDRAIEKAALVDGAERIYLRYLMPGAEREIYLPQVRHTPPEVKLTVSPSLRMDNFPMSSGPDASPLIPDLFHPQKQYIYKLMEADYFPRFLRAKSFCNLTKAGGMIRLIAGFIILWGAFTLAFSFIFLDYPKKQRCWVSPVSSTSLVHMAPWEESDR